MSTDSSIGVKQIGAERQRQIDIEGWTPEHDAEHDGDDLALAALAYVMPGWRRNHWRMPEPDWAPGWFKPTPDDRARELIKAGALIAAAIDRLTEAEATR